MSTEQPVLVKMEERPGEPPQAPPGERAARLKPVDRQQIRRATARRDA